MLPVPVTVIHDLWPPPPHPKRRCSEKRTTRATKNEQSFSLTDEEKKAYTSIAPPESTASTTAANAMAADGTGRQTPEITGWSVAPSGAAVGEAVPELAVGEAVPELAVGEVVLAVVGSVVISRSDTVGEEVPISLEDVVGAGVGAAVKNSPCRKRTTFLLWGAALVRKDSSSSASNKSNKSVLSSAFGVF